MSDSVLALIALAVIAIVCGLAVLFLPDPTTRPRANPRPTRPPKYPLKQILVQFPNGDRVITVDQRTRSFTAGFPDGVIYRPSGEFDALKREIWRRESGPQRLMREMSELTPEDIERELTTSRLPSEAQ